MFIVILLTIGFGVFAQQTEEPCKTVTYDLVETKYDELMTRAQETQTVIQAKICIRQQSASEFGSLVNWAVDNGFEVDLKKDALWGDGTTDMLEVTLNGSAFTKRQVIAFTDKVMEAQHQLAPNACSDVFLLRLSAP